MKTKYVLESKDYTGVYYTGFTTPGGIPEMTNNIDNAAQYDSVQAIESVRSVLANIHEKPMNIREVVVRIDAGKLIDQ